LSALQLVTALATCVVASVATFTARTPPQCALSVKKSTPRLLS
jgi:hypothetical protein